MASRRRGGKPPGLADQLRQCHSSARHGAGLDPQVIVVVGRGGTPSADFGSVDDHGCSWWSRVADADAPDEVAAVLTTAKEQGADIVCVAIAMTDRHDRRVALILPPDRGTWHPFCPTPEGDGRRDNLRELRIRDALADAGLPMESDLSQWPALWDDRLWHVAPDGPRAADG